MADAALDMRAWREAGIQAFGYAACAALFQAPPANDSKAPARGRRYAPCTRHHAVVRAGAGPWPGATRNALPGRRGARAAALASGHHDGPPAHPE